MDKTYTVIGFATRNVAGQVAELKGANNGAKARTAVLRAKVLDAGFEEKHEKFVNVQLFDVGSAMTKEQGLAWLAAKVNAAEIELCDENMEALTKLCATAKVTLAVEKKSLFAALDKLQELEAA